MRTGAALLLLIYAVTATAQAHAALDAALAAYPQIHARETEKLKNGDPTAKFVLARGMNGLGNRNYGLVASFALALYQKAALYVHWLEQGCDGFADAEGVACAAATLESLFANPGIAWTAVRPFGNHGGRNGGSTRVHYVDETSPSGNSRSGSGLGASAEILIDSRSAADELTLHTANLSTWRGTIVHSDHFLLPLILCNPGVSSAGLFPADHIEAQATLERWLLKPSKPIRTAVAQALKRAGGCAVGLHLRGKRHKAAEAGHFHWRVDDVWPRLREEVKRRKGGLFVTADGHLALLRNGLESRAWEEGITVVKTDNLGRGQAGGAMTALAENHILSKCSLIVPSDPSSFL